MQRPAAERILAPLRPCGEKIQPQSEAGFQHHEAVLILPALRQSITGEKNVVALL